MTASKQFQIRLSEDERAVIAQLREELGVAYDAEVLRAGIHALCMAFGIEVPPIRGRGKRRKGNGSNSDVVIVR